MKQHQQQTLMTCLVLSCFKQAKGLSFEEAFGSLLGTAALCGIWPVMLSFLPYKALKRIFPPIVTGVTIFLIGVSLVAVGFKVRQMNGGQGDTASGPFGTCHTCWRLGTVYKSKVA